MANSSTRNRTTPRLHSQASWLHVFPSELGWMAITWNAEQQFTHFTFGHRSPAAAAERFGECDSADVLSENIKKVVARLQRFAAGQPDDFADIDLDLAHLTPFQSSVVMACRQIASGETRSYGELAKIAGSPRAARAVGNVMRGNRFPLIVPCHRVIGSSGKLCGFTSPEGLKMKERLLEREAKFAGQSLRSRVTSDKH